MKIAAHTITVVSTVIIIGSYDVCQAYIINRYSVTIRLDTYREEIIKNNKHLLILD